MDSIIAIILASFCIVTVLSLPLESISVESRAAAVQQQTVTDVEELSRATRQAEDNFGFGDVKTQDEPPTDGCYLTVQVNITSQDSEEQGKTLQTRKCCEGYTGENCNILIDPFSASDPCTGKVCRNDPEAQCAVIVQCGIEVAIFLNDLGQIVEDCEDNTARPSEIPTEEIKDSTTELSNSSSSVANTNITALSCHGYCDFDPCEGQVCSPFPDAFCFQSGCDCQPTWFLDTGVQVNCTSGLEIEPSLASRTRRQASIIGSSCR